MASTEYFYEGSNYGFDPVYGISETYGESFLKTDRYPTSDFGFAVDPMTSNQLQKVSDKISTGAKTVEVQGLGLMGGGGPMKHMDSIPKQQFKEINRLKQLTGVDLTFHGPLVEATGFQGRQGWNESDRLAVERQTTSAIERAHEMDPNGNLVVTFHASNGLPDPETRMIDDKGNEILKDFWVVDEYSGQFENIAPKLSHLKEEVKAKDPKSFLERQNKETWYNQLESINFNIRRGSEPIEELKEMEKGKAFLKLFGKLGTPEAEKIIKELESAGYERDFIERNVDSVLFGDLELRHAYQQFQGIYDRAYAAANKTGNKEDIEKLNKFREEIKSKFEDIENPENVDLLSQELKKGIKVLREISTPQIFIPMRNWAIDKAGETFAHTALYGYDKFKNNAPIISIENPPAGSGLSTGKDLRSLVESARKKFADEAVKKFKMSESQARKQAEKLIGVTWDVGHINMLRGRGYDEKHLLEETKKVGKIIKHVHLSDNFGLEHTELPMGMGNVPTKKMLDLIHGYNKQVKKIVETGDWFSRQGGLAQTQTPVTQTLGAFGSPLYSMKMAPYWNQAVGVATGYYTGQGPINPPVHHSIYGAGFTTLPVELGGQMAGQSRVSGAPIE